MKYVFIAVIAAIIARGILGLINPAALNAPEPPRPVAPHVQVSVEGPAGTVSGCVREAKTGEPLVGTNVLVEGTELGGATDVRGEYRIIHVPAGTHKLSASHVGYPDLKTTVVLDSVHGARADFWLAFTPLEFGPIE